MEYTKVKDGYLISFKTSSNIDSPLLQGIVEYKDQLGFITLVNGIQYELKRLLDIKILSTKPHLPKPIVINNYTINYNPFWKEYQIYHPEIGPNVASFKTQSEAKEYCKKG
jgi:hypothetical protein